MGGTIEEVRKAMEIIEEEGVKISFLLQPTKTKAFWPTQIQAILKPLTDQF